MLTEAEAVGWTHLAHPVGRLAPSKRLPLPIWCLRHRRHKCLPVVRHLLVRRGDWQSCERRRPPRLASPRGINESLDDPRASVRLLQVVNNLSHAETLGAERPEHAEMVLLLLVMLLRLVHMLLLARRGSATRLETCVASI